MFHPGWPSMSSMYDPFKWAIHIKVPDWNVNKVKTYLVCLLSMMVTMIQICWKFIFYMNYLLETSINYFFTSFVLRTNSYSTYMQEHNPKNKYLLQGRGILNSYLFNLHRRIPYIHSYRIYLERYIFNKNNWLFI